MRTLAKWGRWTLALIMSFTFYGGVAMVTYWLVSGFASWAGIESRGFLVVAVCLIGLPLLMGLAFWMSRNPTMQRFDRWLQHEK